MVVEISAVIATILTKVYSRQHMMLCKRDIYITTNKNYYN